MPILYTCQLAHCVAAVWQASGQLQRIQEAESIESRAANQEQAASNHISRQLSLEESSEHGQLLDINDPCAQHIHCRISKMISVDCQPFSTVQDVHLLVEVKYSYQLSVLTDIFKQSILLVVGLSVKINIGAALVSVHTEQV